MHRCTNPECRLQGYRVWVDAGDPYVCDCGEPGTLTATAREHLALARAALQDPGAATRRPA
jgi:hypothetical protein